MQAKLILTFIILLCLIVPVVAQDMEKDTIRLKETIIHNTNKKPKRLSYKFRYGSCRSYEYLSVSNYTELASFANDMPQGKIVKLRFDFNNRFDDNSKVNFTDTLLEINFYEVAEDGFPGEKIASKTITVPGSHTGNMDIDVSELGVYNVDGIYIALNRLTNDKEIGVNEFEVNCSCAGNKKYTMMARRGKTWILKSGLYQPTAFHLVVTLEA
jgi:hypothetical protein